MARLSKKDKDMSPTTEKAPKLPRVQRSFLDLNTFESVTVAKEFVFNKIDSVEAALARLGNDASKLLEVINSGLLAEARREAGSTPEGWKVLEDGEMGEVFAGLPADEKIVNGLVLNVAKSAFGYAKDATPEQKKAAKEAARAFVKNSPPLIEGLKKSAAIKPDGEDDENDPETK